MRSAAEEIIERALSRLPDGLRLQVRNWLEDYQAKAALPESDLCLQSLPLVWAASPFLARLCIRHPDTLLTLAGTGQLTRGPEAGAVAGELTAALLGTVDREDLDRRLRRFRQRQMLRICWRDLAGWASLEETLGQLSELADACIDQALSHHDRWLREHHGVPRDRSGREVGLYVLGMGKLGGGELNVSSDIDLIFGYAAEGETDGERPLDHNRYFTRLGQRLITSLNARMEDGFVFRVDMRLRPYGDSGNLVMSSEQMEAYYENQGREWERYAMIKARVVAGDRTSGQRLLDALVPFIYRRYLDFGALESLRNMKAMIEAEVERRGLRDNIKLGAGGIREVEFVGQAFQLIRGGRERGLQQRRILDVLAYLGSSGALPAFAVRDLMDGYDFLRRSENRLQAVADDQIHTLPTTTAERQRHAVSMGFQNWADFIDRMEQVRRRVRSQFDQVFAAPQAETGPAGPDDNRFAALWNGSLSGDDAVTVLADVGFPEAGRNLQRLLAFRDGSHCRALSETGRGRLDRLMPLLLGAVAMTDTPAATLIRLLDLLEAIVRRSTYIALLVEHPMALSQLVKLCAASPWVARQLARHPLLLDDLLDPRTLYAPLRRQALGEELRQRLHEHPGNDLEQHMEVLRQFKQANTLRVAAADLSGVAPLMVVSDHLTDIAEVVLNEVLALARSHLEARHGRPFCSGPDGQQREAGFAIIAYGKLGGLELGYGSDLDLVFLHGSGAGQALTDGPRPVENAVFFMRLTQRIIHILGATMAGGVLYEVDTRLRPSGRAGLLATSLNAFADYQQTQAWTWEHQALVRARAVAGDPALCAAFEAVRRQQLAIEREPGALCREVCDMRERMHAENCRSTRDSFDLKQERGGIADVEFMVQYGVLAHAWRHPRLLLYTDNIRLLAELSEAGWMTASEAALLADAYRTYRAQVHRATLQEREPMLPRDACRMHSESVKRVWQRLMNNA